LQDSYDRIEARLNRPGALGGNRSGAPGDLTEAYAAISNFTRTGDDSSIRALSVSDDTGAGYLVSPQLSDAIAKRIYDQSPIRQIVRVVAIGDGGSFQEPVDTDDIGAEWVGEEEDRAPTTAPKVGLLDIPLQEIYALQPVTQRLLDDA